MTRSGNDRLLGIAVRDSTMRIESLLIYFFTWLLLALTPGPAVMCIMSQSARYGLQAGFWGILGVQIGNIVFFLCIAFGLAALLATATNAFAVLQIAGAGYLVYFGLRVIISSFRQPPVNGAQPLRSSTESRNLVMQALVVQLTNPKALLFVSALLPQFLDPDGNMLLQLGLLLSCTVVVDMMVLGSYAFLADRGTRSFRRSRLSRWPERAFGAALVAFGVRLLEWRR